MNSLNFLTDINLECIKIASQRMADINLLKEAAKKNITTIISTGMSRIEEVDNVVEIFDSVDKYLLQCTSTYPCPINEINLNVIKTLKDRYKNKICGVGFSGHHTGIAPDLAAYMLGSKIDSMNVIIL